MTIAPQNAPPLDPDGPGKAIFDVISERHRQIWSEGYSVEDDDQYTMHQLADAAAAYALAAERPEFKFADVQFVVNEIWPWSDYDFKPRTHRENLVRAGALILAEIERLDRAAKP